jgi:hypothetical protein
MSGPERKSVLVYELIGMAAIIILGSLLHFTFEWSGSQPVVGVFSAVNESVWEHMKLAFWPSLLFMLLEYALLKKRPSNFAVAKTSGVYLMVFIIPITFYSYTAFTGESVFLIDILTFIVAVIIGQLASYKVLTHKKLPRNLERFSLVALVILSLAFVLFTFYPPQLTIFQDPISGEYGIVNHTH